MWQTETCAAKILSSCLFIALLLSSVFQTGISSVKADVRCYCNMPACVSSGYMCKSPMGVCVSDHFGFGSDVWRSRHSCLELLRTNRREGTLECSEDEDLVDTQFSNYPIRICCKEDMCNYARSESLPQSTIHKLNHSYMTGYLSKEDYFFRNGLGGSGNLFPRQHLWFRAAVIAVPIAGGFILIILIVVAAKILREDHKRQRRQQQNQRSVEAKPHHSNTFDTCVVYNETSTKHQGLLFLPKSISSAIVNIHQQPEDIHNNYVSSNSIDHHSQLYRNVSIAASTDTACTDTSRDKYFVFDV